VWERRTALADHKSKKPGEIKGGLTWKEGKPNRRASGGKGTFVLLNVGGNGGGGGSGAP